MRSTPGRLRTAGAPARGPAAWLALLLAALSPVALLAADGENLAQLHHRLTRARPDLQTPRELALKGALEFALALGNAEGERAAQVLDATGYLPLPLEGDLPETPPHTLSVANLITKVQKRKTHPIGALPADCVQCLDAAATRALFPAVGRWMLPDDRVIVFAPVDAPNGDWITRRGCLVVRIRGTRPTVMGGNVLACLKHPL